MHMDGERTSFENDEYIYLVWVSGTLKYHKPLFRRSLSMSALWVGRWVSCLVHGCWFSRLYHLGCPWTSFTIDCCVRGDIAPPPCLACRFTMPAR